MYGTGPSARLDRHSDKSRFRIPFFRTDLGAEAQAAVARVLKGDHLAGNGRETDAAHTLLRSMIPGSCPLLTHSGTAALEMAALLLDLRAGDEVIMPSWTFPSTANAVVLRGAVPVFVDVASDTLNIDLDQAKAAITPRTRAIICVHYAGVACNMTALTALCTRYDLALIEDAAQAVQASWQGLPLGGFGDFGALSFHSSKNIVSGEGGALLINNDEYVARAEMVWEKGTDRARFTRGEVSRYEWKTVGSSYLPSEMIAALLASQLRRRQNITSRRIAAWNRYDRCLRASGLEEHLILPTVPEGAGHNGHAYAVRTHKGVDRDRLRKGLLRAGIQALTHYVPLHSAPAGVRYGQAMGDFRHTDQAAATLLRLPLDAGITPAEQDEVLDTVRNILATKPG